MCDIFPVSPYDASITYLAMLGCLQISLPQPVKSLARIYGFSETDVKNICPQLVKDLQTDYGISDIGIMLAITNIEQKTSYTFDPHSWIHE